MDHTTTANRNVSGRMHRQTMIERTEMYTVDRDLVLIHLDQHQYVERLPIVDGAPAVAFLSTPHLILKRVSYDHRFIGPNTKVQRDVIPRVQCSARLYIDLAPFSVIVDDAFNTHH